MVVSGWQVPLWDRISISSMKQKNSKWQWLKQDRCIYFSLAQKENKGSELRRWSHSHQEPRILPGLRIIIPRPWFLSLKAPGSLLIISMDRQQMEETFFTAISPPLFYLTMTFPLRWLKLNDIAKVGCRKGWEMCLSQGRKCPTKKIWFLMVNKQNIDNSKQVAVSVQNFGVDPL